MTGNSAWTVEEDCRAVMFCMFCDVNNWENDVTALFSTRTIKEIVERFGLIMSNAQLQSNMRTNFIEISKDKQIPWNIREKCALIYMKVKNQRREIKHVLAKASTLIKPFRSMSAVESSLNILYNKRNKFNALKQILNEFDDELDQYSKECRIDPLQNEDFAINPICAGKFVIPLIKESQTKNGKNPKINKISHRYEIQKKENLNLYTAAVNSCLGLELREIKLFQHINGEKYEKYISKYRKRLEKQFQVNPKCLAGLYGRKTIYLMRHPFANLFDGLAEITFCDDFKFYIKCCGDNMFIDNYFFHHDDNIQLFDGCLIIINAIPLLFYINKKCTYFDNCISNDRGFNN